MAAASNAAIAACGRGGAWREALALAAEARAKGQARGEQGNRTRRN